MSKVNQNNMPEPILFNPLKHHAGYIHEFTREVDVDSESSREILQACLTTIGKSQMDLYTGSIPSEQVAGEIKHYLEKRGLIEENLYLSWLGRGNEPYKMTRISDNSIWILLAGKVPARWVHIHPGRYSPHTLRVRSETLKTAIAVICFCNKYDLDYNNLTVINHVRTCFLDLSPMKEISAAKGTGRIIRLLANFSKQENTEK